MSLIEWINTNITFNYGEIIASIMIGILFLLVYDFYHLLFNSITSWFKKT